MTLSGDDVRNTVFRVSLRGYAVDEVDAFLDRVQAALDARNGDPSLRDAAVAGVAEAPSERGMRLLGLAEQTATRLVDEARSEAEAVLAAARAEAEQVLAGAQAEAHRVRGELAEARERQSAELERSAAGLRREIDALQQRERALRERLVAMLTEQLQTVQREPLRLVPISG